MSMYGKNHYNIVISLQLIKIIEKKQKTETTHNFNMKICSSVADQTAKMRSCDFYQERLCCAELQNMKNTTWLNKVIYGKMHNTHHLSFTFLLQGIHLHCPKSMSTVLWSLCLFHDKHIEYITLNLYKQPAYKSPKDWIKRKSLHFEEKIALIQCFEINEKACRPEGIHIGHIQERH